MGVSGQTRVVSDIGKHISEINARIDRLPALGLGRFTFLVIGLSYFFVYFDISVIGFTLPKLTEVFNLTATQAAYPVTLYLLGYVVGDYLLSLVADRLGRRKALLYTVLIVAVGGLFSAFAWDLWSLAIFRFITGVGTGAEIAIASTIVTEFSPSKTRGKYLQLMYFWGAAGLTITPFISLALIDLDNGWRIIFGLGALVAVILIFMRSRYLPESPRWLILNGKSEEAEQLVSEMEHNVRRKTGMELPPVPVVPPEEEARGSITKTLFLPPYLNRTVVTLAFWLVWLITTYAYLSYAPTILIEAGNTASSGLLFTALGYLGTPVGALIALLLIDKMERKYFMFLVTLAFAIGLCIMTITSSNLFVISGAFICSMMVAANSAGYVYMAEIYPTRVRTTGVAITEGGGQIGGIIAPFLTVALLAQIGGIGTLYVLAAIVLFSGFIILIGGMKTTGKELTKIAD
ncbi:MFS transporter [Bacillus sp. FJAT-29790]|uniref:MFS transporter n=1 Tax=Bacillus sp. FJAT-29790 TaxID=1895002 RepID=UPI001C24714D|nr:MFS transporter [Bacillus sp. FJAT-29790]MBU8877520.1 MFS transporter [Bacillus sp. FJAT-29790]